MKRRTFIAGLGAAAAWPLAARGQQAAEVDRILKATNDGELERVFAIATDERMGAADHHR